MKPKGFLTFFTILLFLYFYELLNGYPMFYTDIIRYLDGINLKYNYHSNVGVMVLFAPIFKLWGFKGWYIVQALIASYALTVLKEKLLKEVPLIILLVALFLSMYGFVVLTLIPDFFTFIGLICFLLLARNKSNTAINILLGISILSHQAHYTLFPILFLTFYLIYKEIKLLKIGATIISLTIIYNIGFAYFTTGVPSIVSPIKCTIFSARLLADSPSAINGYSKINKDSYISKNKKTFISFNNDKHYLAKHKYIEMPDKAERLLWSPHSPIAGKHMDFNSEACSFIGYALRNHWKEYILRFLNNSKEQLLIYPKPAAIIFNSYRKNYFNILDKYTPSEKEEYLSSRQNKKTLQKFQFPELTRGIFLLCLALNFLSLRKRKESLEFAMSLLSILTITTTILLMPNLSTISSRYLLRVVPITLIPGIIDIYSYLTKKP